ncbi:MAG: prepilin-type N-terminal cleavage/methylation domain-containing protein [Chlamydiia bacterium]|nr:prepilin-type N-terminal cleavage/methylation domain-containing protein [Chlamydiia bacterium]
MNRAVAKRRRAITLIEIMIVMFLIALIGGVVAYNMKGALDKGKVFKTEQGMERLRSTLEMHIAEYPDDADRLESEWVRYVEQSPLVKNPKELTRDGWGQLYDVRMGQDGEIIIRSEAYERYKRGS